MKSPFATTGGETLRARDRKRMLGRMSENELRLVLLYPGTQPSVQAAALRRLIVLERTNRVPRIVANLRKLMVDLKRDRLTSVESSRLVCEFETAANQLRKVA